MPRRVNPVVLLGIVSVAVLSLGMVASAQILEGPVDILPAAEGPVDPSLAAEDPAFPVQEQFAQGLGGTASDALGVGERSSASPS